MKDSDIKNYIVDYLYAASARNIDLINLKVSCEIMTRTELEQVVANIRDMFCEVEIK